MELNDILKTAAPFMDQQTFADTVGVSKRVVSDYISKGYLPSISLSNGATASKRTFVNCVALREFLAQSGQEWVQQSLGAA